MLHFVYVISIGHPEMYREKREKILQNHKLIFVDMKPILRMSNHLFIYIRYVNVGRTKAHNIIYLRNKETQQSIQFIARIPCNVNR